MMKQLTALVIPMSWNCNMLLVLYVNTTFVNYFINLCNSQTHGPGGTGKEGSHT